VTHVKPTSAALLGLLFVSPLLAPAIAAAQPAAKPPKAVKACGITVLPLTVGNQWVYEPSLPPADRILPEAQLRATPVQPKKLTITVKAIDAKPEGTTVTLTEDLDGKAHETTIKCTAAGQFQVAMDSFWFAGEPGTTYGIELTDTQRKGNTLMLLAGKINGLEWYDDVETKWKHVPVAKPKPKSRSGTMSIKRHWVVLPEEKITGKDGQELKTIKLGVETTVTTTIEPPTTDPLRPSPLLVNLMWIVDGTGPVQVLNSFGQQYALTSFVIAK
jgi:hypothetical protein